MRPTGGNRKGEKALLPSAFQLSSFQFYYLNSLRKAQCLPPPQIKTNRLHLPNLWCWPACIRLWGQKTKFAPIYTCQNIHPCSNQVENVNKSSTVKTHDCLEGSELPNLFVHHCQPSLTCPAGGVMVPWAWGAQAIWKWLFLAQQHRHIKLSTTFCLHLKFWYFVHHGFFALILIFQNTAPNYYLSWLLTFFFALPTTLKFLAQGEHLTCLTLILALPISLWSHSHNLIHFYERTTQSVPVSICI